MVDGLLVTAAERLEVSSFFDSSARTQRPVVYKFNNFNRNS
jgi:hypothetical protein